MKKMYNAKKILRSFLAFAVAMTLVVEFFSVDAQASEKSFKEGVLYSDGDTINFGKEEPIYFKLEELLYRVKGTLTVKQTGNKSEKAYSFNFVLNDDTVLEYYSESLRSGWTWTENDHEYDLPVILPGKNYPKGFVFTNGSGTEESPYVMQASSSSVKVEEVDESETMKKKIKVTQTSGKVTVTWTKANGAASYEVFTAYDGKSYSKKPTYTVSKNKIAVKKVGTKKISLKKVIKVLIIAKDNAGNVIGKIELKIVGKKNSKYSADSSFIIE